MTKTPPGATVSSKPLDTLSPRGRLTTLNLVIIEWRHQARTLRSACMGFLVQSVLAPKPPGAPEHLRPNGARRMHLLVASTRLVQASCTTPRQMSLVKAMFRA